jgi:hypothetical protein
VFEIEATWERVDEWLRYGLPPLKPASVETLDWRDCPFLPENGYGRITADHLSGDKADELLAGGVHV